MTTAAPRANGRTRGIAAAPPEPVVQSASALSEALLAVQDAAPVLVRTATGQIQNRTYRYVTLDALLTLIQPLLLEHQLLWMTFPTSDDHGEPALRYRLTHTPSGESIEDVMPLMCAQQPNPQGMGSAITYARRYSLMAVLNLAPDEDDDGAGAGAIQPRDRYAEAEAAHAELDKNPNSPQPTARAPKPSERRITANQRTKLLIPRAQKAGLTDAEFANVILIAAGEPPRTWSSPEHEAQTLDRLLDQLPARLKDAVLSGIDEAQVAKLAGSGKR